MVSGTAWVCDMVVRAKGLWQCKDPPIFMVRAAVDNFMQLTSCSVFSGRVFDDRYWPTRLRVFGGGLPMPRVSTALINYNNVRRMRQKRKRPTAPYTTIPHGESWCQRYIADEIEYSIESSAKKKGIWWHYFQLACSNMQAWSKRGVLATLTYRGYRKRRPPPSHNDLYWYHCIYATKLYAAMSIRTPTSCCLYFRLAVLVLTQRKSASPPGLYNQKQTHATTSVFATHLPQFEAIVLSILSSWGTLVLFVWSYHRMPAWSPSRGACSSPRHEVPIACIMLSPF